METLQTPLNKAQLELLKLFSKVNNEAELMEIKALIGQYYANKAIKEADKLWDERGYTQETMEEWLSHEHKHANRS
jgi:hypothetical protein